MIPNQRRGPHEHKKVCSCVGVFIGMVRPGYAGVIAHRRTKCEGRGLSPAKAGISWSNEGTRARSEISAVQRQHRDSAIHGAVVARVPTRWQDARDRTIWIYSSRFDERILLSAHRRRARYENRSG